MNRREFLKSLALGVIGCGVAPEAIAQTLGSSPPALPMISDNYLRDYLYKMNHFNEPHKDDIVIKNNAYNMLGSTVMRLKRLQQLVGHGNFNLLSFNGGINIARKYSEVGEFTKAEISLMERVFYEDSAHYGFLGEKPMEKISTRIKKDNVINIDRSGTYLYKGTSIETYLKIKKQLGNQVILTSGVRGIMKQFLLFLNKSYKKNGNFSLASRSLAPPGYSFHGNGDFDVGQVGLGVLNFTENFTNTEVYKRLNDMGYLNLRYDQNNHLGVRYEPWHIQINI